MSCFLLVCLVVFEAYEKIAETTIEDSIKSELSGDFETLMLAVGENCSTHATLFHDSWLGNVQLTIDSGLSSDTVLQSSA